MNVCNYKGRLINRRGEIVRPEIGNAEHQAAAAAPAHARTRRCGPVAAVKWRTIWRTRRRPECVAEFACHWCGRELSVRAFGRSAHEAKTVAAGLVAPCECGAQWRVVLRVEGRYHRTVGAFLANLPDVAREDLGKCRADEINQSSEHEVGSR